MEGTIATITLFAGNFAPRNWAYCAGQLLNISQNTALFSLVGTMYGGDGRTTFGLPDFRGRTAVGAGTGAGLSNYVQGEKTGVENNTLLMSNLPSHTHVPVISAQLPINGDAPTTDNPDGAFPSSGGSNIYNSSPGNQQFAGAFHTVASVGIAGNGIPMNNLQPYLGMNYIICTAGVFPYRP